MTDPTGGGDRLRRLVRAPLLHFLAIGGAAFLAVQLTRPPPPAFVVHLSAADVAWLEAAFTEQAGRPPDDPERTALIESEIADRLLLAEAFALGWHRTDGVATRRLVQNQRFLSPDDPASDDELLERARAQGMDRSDIVVRRRLLERMRLALASRTRETAPSREELEACRLARADRFVRPERTRLSHVFLSRDRRGDDLQRDAESLGHRIAAGEIAPEQVGRYSDPSLVRTSLPLASEAAIARELGAEFAAAAVRAPLGEWTGPIRSAYGLHFVYVHERVPAVLPALAEIESEVRAEWMRERERRAIRDHVAALRERAEIVVDPTTP